MGVILVTGAAGFVGGHLINSLLGDERFSGYRIRGVDNFLVGRPENYNLVEDSPRVELGEGDFTSEEDVKKMTEDAEIVYHLGAISGVVFCNTNPVEASRINLEGTRKLLEASMSDCEHFVFPSSAAVYGRATENPMTEEVPVEPQNIYGALKVSAEALCDAYHHSHGLATTVLRWTNIYGKGTYAKWRTVVPAFVRRAVEGQPLQIHGTGTQKRNFIHIDDTVELYKRVIDKKAISEKFNAGGKEDISIAELAETVKKLALKNHSLEVEVNYTPARDSAPESSFSISTEKLRNTLGWKPSISVEEGVSRNLEAALSESREGFYEGQKPVTGG